MRNWKDVPHLFIGFMILSKSTNSSFPFRGRDIDEGLHKREGITLIARKVEDMTDEELNTSFLVTKDSMIRNLSKLAIDEQLWSKDFLYLLSIGVYPFSQKHFEDETVIDIITLTEQK